jgi:dTDP-glucose pyrophosphorylase
MRRVNLIPMAGAGQRFLDVGYQTPKPLINVGDLPMVVRAANCLPPADHWIFICREEHIQQNRIDEVLKEHFSDLEIISVGHLTEGQASTCLLAREHLLYDDQLTIGACDNAMEYDLECFKQQISRTDALIWTFRNNPVVLQNPQMYGWVEVDDSGMARRISCKEPISDDPLHDHAVIGAFSFRRAETFLRCVETMIGNNRRINNEFYMDVALDECIQLGFVVRPMEVSRYVCWGTPQDLVDYRNRLKCFES